MRVLVLTLRSLVRWEAVGARWLGVWLEVRLDV